MLATCLAIGLGILIIFLFSRKVKEGLQHPSKNNKKHNKKENKKKIKKKIKK